ncbi:MAG: peptidylprolyl isomerase [Candidatus Micrarchaeota archaeon]|nr:peptidylprolyl isomerase [Candidatus Micrarchaeota archaeon]
MEKGDFIMLDLEGKDSSGEIFDSTKGDIAKKLHGKEGPMLLIYGHAMMIKGLDNAIKGMKEGESKGVVLDSNDAFGQKDQNKLKVYPVTEFIKAGYKSLSTGMMMVINVPGGQLTGTIKSISNGRVTVDFNHPLAGKRVFYELKIEKVIKDLNEKVAKLCETMDIVADVNVNEKEKRITVNVREDKNSSKATLHSNLEHLFPEYKRDVNDAGKAEGAK